MTHKIFDIPARLRPTAVLINLALAGGLLVGCGGGDGDDKPAGPRDVGILFEARAGNAPVTCDAPVAALGSGAVQTQIRDMRFYVSNVRLIDKNGAEVPVTLAANDWQHAGGVTLIDLENAAGACAGGTPATNNAVTGSVPAGDYVGMAMTVGVPPGLNHSDYATAPKPFDIQAMAWSWQAGRKFMKVDVNPSGGVTTPGNPNANPPTPDVNSSTFNFHLGSTGCTGNPASGEVVNCSAPNRIELKFTSFNPDTQKIALDVQQLFLQSNLSANLGGALGCMSGKTDPECPAMFGVIGLDIDSGQTVNQGANQQVFRAVAK